MTKNIDFDKAKLDKLQAQLVEMAQLKGKQDALISVMQDIIYRQLKDKRKTIDIDYVRGLLDDKLKDNEAHLQKLMREYRGIDKVVSITEYNKWTTLK